MSLEAMVWVYREAPIPKKTPRGVPNPGVLTAALLCLADGYSEETGLAFRSLSNVSKYTRMDERTIRDAVRALQMLGILEYHEEDQAVVRAVIKRTDWRPNGYRINFNAPRLRYDEGKGEWVPDNEDGGVAHPAVDKPAVQRGGRSPGRSAAGGSLTRNGGVPHPQRGGRSPGKLKGNSRGNSRGGSGTDAKVAVGMGPIPPSPETLESELETPAASASPAAPPASPAPAITPTETPTAVTGVKAALRSVPSRSCNRHPDGTSEPCGPCADARRAYDASFAEQEAERKAAKVQVEQSERAAFWQAIDACEYCDDKGTRSGTVQFRCDHTADQVERTKRGSAAAREVARAAAASARRKR